MIKNIVFDMGGVLIKFDRQYFLSKLNVSDEDKKLLFNEVFATVEWAMMDRGTISNEDALRNMKNNLPEHLHQYADTLVLHWEQMSNPIEGVEQIVKELKDNGYGIYLLSNASKRIYEYWNTIPGNELFDGMLVSCDYNACKPEREIYKLLNTKYNLNLDECLFIDDTNVNVEAAIYNGLDAIIFRGDSKVLRKKLIKKGIKIKSDQ